MLKRWAQAAMVCILAVVMLGADTDSRFGKLGHQMMCVCGCGQILLECNHVGCKYSDTMRAELMAGVERGESDDLTLQGFVQKYGTTVLAAPTQTGFNRLAWIMPYLALGLGLITVSLIVRAWKRRPLVLPADAVRPVSGKELEQFREQARRETEPL